MQLGQSIDNWDCILIFLISQKRDNATSCDWERHTRTNSNMSTIDEFLNFLRERANFLDSINYKTNNTRDKPTDRVNFKVQKRETSKAFVVGQYTCSYCKEQHSIYTCDQLLKLSIVERNQFIKRNSSICANCLREGHSVQKCKLGPCKVCKSRHNTLLHNSNPESRLEDSRKEVEDASSCALSSGVLSPSNGRAILSTASVLVTCADNELLTIRALLDCGSQTSFITDRVQRKLNIPTQDTNLAIFGIANNVSSVKRKCEVHMKSRCTSFTANIACYVLSEITGYLPEADLNWLNMSIPSGLKLADEDFDKSGPIDMLIGADLFWHILGPNKIAFGKNKPCLQETKLGWIVCGQVGTSNPKRTSCNLSINQELHKLLTQFWEIEEFPNNKVLSQDEAHCEKIFSETTSRNPDGRFVVNLPLKQSPKVLGESRAQAEKRFCSLECRLIKNDKLYSMYKDFMAEYKLLNHASLCNESDQPQYEYYMPHHGVLKESSLTTKLRVVFDAFAATSSGLSLNNIQLIGPVIQSDLLSIILRFRQHTFVMSADIAKMYRQVLVHPAQRSLQRILWRDHPSKPIETYELNTVTYGQASASFLAIRCLFELSEKLSPNIARVIKEDFYVDDMLTGADSLQQARQICSEVSKALKKGYFELRKWCSNEPRVLHNINRSNLIHDILDFSGDDKTKTLGLTWACKENSLLNKRSTLSCVARIFDPLGLLSPCIIISKIILQKTWSEKIAWDDDLPNDLKTSWLNFLEELPVLNNLSIVRHAIICDAVDIQLHGFCDSSERAYGACIYLRSTDRSRRVKITLLYAKSKVAPIKTITIPRLELCAALLLARLTDKVVKSLRLHLSVCHLWSDSTITLAWIKTSPNLLKTFTANRVSEIQKLTVNCQWHHVRTLDNPADIVSRGLYPKQILHCTMWWNGPVWLTLDPSSWPNEQMEATIIPELKCQALLAQESNYSLNFPFQNFSSFSKLRRVVAYVLRFASNCKRAKPERETGSLTISEIRYASKCLIKVCQFNSFSLEFQDISKNGIVKIQNKLAGLASFIDDDGILRVGGRLKYSKYKFDKRHPILLHSRHHLTKLLFAEQHLLLMHAGPQLLLGTIRNSFWPIAGRNLARATVRKCLRCFRFNAKSIQPMMGNLPNFRVTPSGPFSVVGVDYAGPFIIKDRMGRGCRTSKCYIGLFICLATTAIHLEIISSLSSEAFLQALRRFVSRRGKPSKMLSDNGTNFVGAQKELGNLLKSREMFDDVSAFSSKELIEWQFIPPHSPHFGGIWEAGVKSCKHHLKRVISETPLSFEEFCTVCAQIEAILNSRPLLPLSSDPNDYGPLTPAHFLIGKPMVAAPDHDVTDLKINRLNRYQLLQQMCQHFWRRWATEYISELQLRGRWKQTQGELAEGTLVLIKEDNTRPTQWQLGRIASLHPGPDGISRVASIKTSSGVIKRGYQRICPLPISD